MENSKLLFNEKCAICNFEIKHYKKRSNLQFEDCSSMNEKYLKKLHVVFDDGKELSGVDAFIYVWERTNGYNWVARIITLKSSYLYLLIIFTNVMKPRFNIFIEQ